jgi:hypothetical protein
MKMLGAVGLGLCRLSCVQRAGSLVHVIGQWC